MGQTRLFAGIKWYFWISVFGVSISGFQKTFADNNTDSSRVCEEALGACIFSAALPFAHLNAERALDLVRRTSLMKQCSTWREPLKCSREEIQAGRCSGESSKANQHFTVGLQVLDYVVNYTCRENFFKMNRNYRCMLTLEVYNKIFENCKRYEVSEKTACNLSSKIGECSGKAVESVCGSEAGDILRDLVPKIWPRFVEVTVGVHCSSPKAELIAKFLRRFFR